MTPAHILYRRGREFRDRERARRSRGQERLAARIKTPIAAQNRQIDPLDRYASTLGAVGKGTAIVLAAALVHAATIAALLFTARPHTADPPKSQPIRVTVVEPKNELKPEPKKVVAEPEPSATVAKKPPPKRKKRRRRVRPKKPAEATPPPARTAHTPRRIVGINMAATVSGGSGPGYAVGNTVRGQTARRARDPVQSSARAQPSANRRARFVPSAGASFAKPRRLRPIKPIYPKLLRARSIEGDVVVSVIISASGQVTRATLAQPSRYAEFNRSALAAARRQRFAPARKNGEPIEYNLTYTYRFRLDET
ncbi:MAG: TonB family protein [Proteobacteria bacterium]|nr:TonB family protein [Pseudomonadota bacterium]